MIAIEAKQYILHAISEELENIIKKYGGVYASEHEGYAVLLEEVQEAEEDYYAIKQNLEKVWKKIRNNKAFYTELKELQMYASALAEEAVQCAAVCERFLDTIKREEKA